MRADSIKEIVCRSVAAVAILCVGQSPALGISPARASDLTSLGAELPPDVVLTPPATLENRQRDFDLFAWKSFAFLTSPAPGNSEQAVWETYLLNTQVIKPDGGAPDAWGTPQPIPRVCRELGESLPDSAPVITTALDAFRQVFEMGPLIDPNGRLVRYDIRMNRDTYAFIDEQGLYNREGQRAYDAAIDFPAGDDATGAIGAMTLKSAWKELGPNDDPSRFYARRAYLYTPSVSEPPEPESCRVAILGLVGLHIARKTVTAPQWIWATFEHVDNVPSLPLSASTADRSYNFYDQHAPERPVNVAPARPWTSGMTGEPSQVVRFVPIGADTARLNTEIQREYRRRDPASPWQYYELVGTQWPTQPDNPLDPMGAPQPQVLANATMETYVQGVWRRGQERAVPVPQGTSSCINCHGNATSTTAHVADFVYLLGMAREKTRQGGD